MLTALWVIIEFFYLKVKENINMFYISLGYILYLVFVFLSKKDAK